MGTLSIVVEPDECRSVSLGGTGTVFEVSTEDTRWPSCKRWEVTVAVVEYLIESGPRGDDRCEGQLPEDHRLAGQVLNKLRGEMHTFWNPGRGPPQLSGFETYFIELAGA